MGNINRHTAPCAIAGPQEAPNKYKEQSFGEPYAEPDGARGGSWTFRLVCRCVKTEHLEIDRDWHDQDRWIEGMNMKSRVPSGHANQETQEQGADVFLTAVWSPSGSMFIEGCHVPQCQCTESRFKLCQVVSDPKRISPMLPRYCDLQHGHAPNEGVCIEIGQQGVLWTNIFQPEFCCRQFRWVEITDAPNLDHLYDYVHVSWPNGFQLQPSLQKAKLLWSRNGSWQWRSSWW